jgi:hypothetical protein
LIEKLKEREGQGRQKRWENKIKIDGVVVVVDTSGCVKYQY